MKDLSIFKGVIFFHAEGLSYQAVWENNDHWEMAALDGATVLEMHDIYLPYETTPGQLLTEWWKAQKETGTYSNTAANRMLERGTAEVSAQ